ncbi:hypothetical protein [Xanthobacter sediminis]|uniref:hypothetical protein n=1 Tax=Xanthobacter sediminis TaxID=3119926 RepID=UPI00372BB43A
MSSIGIDTRHLSAASVVPECTVIVIGAVTLKIISELTGNALGLTSSHKAAMI